MFTRPSLFFTSILFFIFSIFFFTDTATTEIYTLSLHDALPIYLRAVQLADVLAGMTPGDLRRFFFCSRSEEHTSELQSQFHLVCRLLLEKKKKSPPQTNRSRGYRT